jgi:hypothetical protein
MISVTITGLDDRVNLHDLFVEAERHPDTEWGVLLSASRMGTPRYPSARWLHKLQAFLANRPDFYRRIRLAAHLCGSIAREPKHAALPIALGPFHRAQINGYTLGTADDWRAATDGTRCRLILQAREEASLQLVATEAARIGADVLFDPSGGQGIEPFRWPAAPLGVRVGFAGGIKPENVEDVVASILSGGTRASDGIWIDMESGVRSADDRLDWSRVRTVLGTVAAINGRLAASL